MICVKILFNIMRWVYLKHLILSYQLYSTKVYSIFEHVELTSKLKVDYCCNKNIGAGRTV